MAASFDVNRLRRRPPGPKTLVYLDQSTLSYLARPEGAALLAALDRGVKSDRLICPWSHDHDDESVLAEQAQAQLHRIIDQLSMGIRFRDDKQITQHEILNAAAAFSGSPPLFSISEEAFQDDPHAPRRTLFPGGIRVSLSAVRPDWLVKEVARGKDGTDAFSAVYETVRQTGTTFEEQAAREYKSAVLAELGLMINPAETNKLGNKLRVAAAEEMRTETPDPDRIFGPALSRFMYFQDKINFCKTILSRFETVAAYRFEFLNSPYLQVCPALSYPSLLFAATAVTLGRREHPSDRYDRSHLMKGLSRCDVVTADRGHAQMLRERSLIPSDVQLFSSGEHAQLLACIEEINNRP